jgi:DNA-binding LytR/AlgR family response regulator
MWTLERYLHRERLYVALLLLLVLLINTTINATSILMEAQRSGVHIRWSDPFITEYSSAISFFILFPAVLWLARRFPLKWGSMRRHGLYHLGFSALFCIAHVALFMAIRKPAFYLQGLDYQLADDWLMTFIYEYRKDAWTYALMLLGIHTYSFVISRLRGEAVPVGSGEDAAPEPSPERFLVRKLGKEFVVKTGDIQWLEAAGNYVNLHVGERVYPLRSTMAILVDSLDSQGFIRIHRSHAINLDFVESITPLESGDCTVTLDGGKTLNLSRRYRDAFKEQLGQRAG